MVVLGRGRGGGGVDGGEDEVERVKAVNSKKTAGSRLLVILEMVQFQSALLRPVFSMRCSHSKSLHFEAE